MTEHDPCIEKLTEAAKRFREAKRLMDQAFADCIERGYPYPVIGEAMGVSRQEIHRRKLRRGIERKVDG